MEKTHPGICVFAHLLPSSPPGRGYHFLFLEEETEVPRGIIYSRFPRKREVRRAKPHLHSFLFTYQCPRSLPAHRSQSRVQIDFCWIELINELIQNCYNTRQIMICILTVARGITGMPRNKVNWQRTQGIYSLRG